MRKISFRGKRVDNGEWIYGDLVAGRISVPDDIDTEDYYEDWKDVYSFYKVMPGTVGQLLSTKDQNDKECYEGDIIQTGKSVINIFIIGFWGDSFSLFHEYPFPEYPTKLCSEYRPFLNRKFIVIGNIHDNPELIKSPCTA